MAENQKRAIIEYRITQETMLYQSYMPFVQHGGIFIPTTERYSLGEEVFVLLSLPNESDKQPIAGRVVWMTPEGAQGNQMAGIGIALNDINGSAKSLVDKIETLLADQLKSEKLTYTM